MAKPVAPEPRTTAAWAGCCRPLLQDSLTPDQVAALASMFKALADPVRLRLMSLIASMDEVCPCDLTGLFDVSGPTISYHLRTLREAGLVDRTRRGTWIYYRARPAALRQLGDLLAVPGVGDPVT